MATEFKGFDNPKEIHSKSLEQLTKEELYDMVYRDEITGHYNWRFLWGKMNRAKLQEDYCFVHFNIKDFKMINEVYGHNHGNEVLRMICRALERQGEWLLYSARTDNDNFAMMVKAMSPEEIRKHMESFFEEISSLPFNEEFKLYYRCGIVLVDDILKGEDRVADFARMAQQMGNRHNCTEIFFYTGEMYEKMVRDKNYLTYFQKALQNEEFLVYLQPKYDAVTEKIVGAEALSRWNYKKKRILSPAEYIPMLEEYDAIGKLDFYVFRKACEILADMKEKGLDLFPISVNLSKSHMKNDKSVEQFCKCADEYGIPHNLLEIELTESAAFKDRETMFRMLDELRKDGFSISMDDFGTGYSSLSLLRTMPMDTLKIDKSFVDSIDAENYYSRECLLIKDIIYMTKHLGFCCVAEGAEERAQIDFLRKCGCDQIQGFYFSKPVPIDEYKMMVRAQMENEKRINR